MKLSATLLLLAATLAAATPLTPRDDTESGVVAPVDASELQFLTADDDFVPPANTTTTEVVLVDEEVVDDGKVLAREDLVLPRGATNTGVLSPAHDRVTWTFAWSQNSIHGEMVIVMNKTGWTRFKTYFKSSTFWKREYKVNCVFHDRAGIRYDGLSRSGTLRRHHSHHKDTTWNWPLVHDHWTDIEKSDLKMECSWKAARNV